MQNVNNLHQKINNSAPGLLIIEKLELTLPLYSKDSKENNIEENATFLSDSITPEKENGNIIIAAHSGSGKIAYFKDLDKIIAEDEINIKWNNKNELYKVYKIRKTIKNGTILIPSNTSKKRLILTTCMPNEKENQLTIYAEKKS